MPDTHLEHAFQWVANSKGLFDFWGRPPRPDDIHETGDQWLNLRA
jgi:hypothetical protein